MSVSEDKVVGEEVGRLKAKDPDLGENGLVTYRLIEGDGIDIFEITTDSQTREGVIKLKKVSRGRVKDGLFMHLSHSHSVDISQNKSRLGDAISGF